MCIEREMQSKSIIAYQWVQQNNINSKDILEIAGRQL